MSELGNGKVPAGGVLLGQREMRVQLSREDYAKLTVLAQVNNTGETQMLSFIASQGIGIGFAQFVYSKLNFILSHWYQYVN